MRALASLVLVAAASACSKKEPEKLRTEPWQNPLYQTSAQASSAPSAAPGASERYALSASDLAFSLPAKERTTRGRLTAASGELRLTRGNLGASRATVTVDLTSLSIDAADGGADDHAAFTRRALEWLELGEQVSASVRERHRLAHFELSGLERPSEGKNPGAWQAIAKGQLSLHGFRVPVEQPISFELGADKVVIRSQRPLLIKLAEHDLRPRNGQGQVVSTELPLLGTQIGREARVEFELVFRAAPEQKSQQE